MLTLDKIPPEIFESLVLLRLPPHTFSLFVQANKTCRALYAHSKAYWEYITVLLLWQRCFDLDEELSFKFSSLTGLADLWRLEGMHGLTRREMIDKYCAEEEPRLAVYASPREIVQCEMARYRLKQSVLRRTYEAMEASRNIQDEESQQQSLRQMWTEHFPEPDPLVPRPRAWDWEKVYEYVEDQMIKNNYCDYCIKKYFKFSIRLHG